MFQTHTIQRMHGQENKARLFLSFSSISGYLGCLQSILKNVVWGCSSKSSPHCSLRFFLGLIITHNSFLHIKPCSPSLFSLLNNALRNTIFLSDFFGILDSLCFSVFLLFGCEKTSKSFPFFTPASQRLVRFTAV